MCSSDLLGDLGGPDRAARVARAIAARVLRKVGEVAPHRAGELAREVGRVGAFEAQLIADIKSREPGIMDAIRVDLELKPDTEKKLLAFLDNFARSFG